MLDFLIMGGTVIDGTGAELLVADVGVKDGKIVAVERISSGAGSLPDAARETVVDATGLWVTPGFIDIHAHDDGQLTWDETFTPSICTVSPR